MIKKRKRKNKTSAPSVKLGCYYLTYVSISLSTENNSSTKVKGSVGVFGMIRSFIV